MTRLLLIALLFGCTPTLATPPLRVGGERVHLELGHVPLARASLEPRGPVVYYAEGLTEHTPAVQWWAVGHELCHLSDPHRAETDADCCALRWVRRSFGYTRVEFAEIVETVHGWRRSPRHPGGTARTVALLECAEELGL